MHALYKTRFEGGYDLGGLDPDYTAWLKCGHPDIGKSILPAANVLSGANKSSSSDVLGRHSCVSQAISEGFQEKKAIPQ